MNTQHFLARAVAYLKPITAPTDNPPRSIAQDLLPVTKPLGERLCVSYVVDEPHGLVYISERQLKEANMTLDQLHMIGLRNLDSMKKRVRIEQHGPIHGIFLDGNFEASLFLLRQFWHGDLGHLVNKSFTIAMPARDVLAFCDSDSADGVAALNELIERVYEGGDHLITRQLFTKVKG